MLKYSKNFIILCIIASLGLLFAGIYFPRASEQSFAQDRDLICDTKIPIGEAIEATRDILDDIYVPLQEMYKEVSGIINTASTQLQTLGKDAKNCDFSVCKADCRDIGPDVDLELRAFFFKIADYPACVALCEGDLGLNRACQGKPCPDLQASTEMFEKELTRIKDLKQRAVNVLRGEEPDGVRKVTEDIAREWENENTSIPKIEFARRKLDRARKDFLEWAMSEEDWQKAARNELTPRLVKRCPDELIKGNYWPKPWLEDCPKQCQELTRDKLFETDICRICICYGGADSAPQDRCHKCIDPPNPEKEKYKNNPGEYNQDLIKFLTECQACLDSSELFNYLPQAAISCKLFGACKYECEKGLTEECQACICTGFTDIEKCRQWLCGGSMLNWVGCH